MIKPLLVASAVMEAAIGLALLAWPSLPALVLLGTTLDAPAALVVARVAGGALLSLALACWCARDAGTSPAARGVVGAMLAYNAATAIVLMHGGLVFHLSGIALWPTVVLHLAMAVWCAAGLRSARHPGAA